MKLKNGSRLIRRLSYIGHRSLIMITLILNGWLTKSAR